MMKLTKDMKRNIVAAHEANNPLIERNGKAYLRFDKIEIAPIRAGMIAASYFWMGNKVSVADMPTADALTSTIILGGFTGEMEVTYE